MRPLAIADRQGPFPALGKRERHANWFCSHARQSVGRHSELPTLWRAWLQIATSRRLAFLLVVHFDRVRAVDGTAKRFVADRRWWADGERDHPRVRRPSRRARLAVRTDSGSERRRGVGREICGEEFSGSRGGEGHHGPAHARPSSRQFGRVHRSVAAREGSLDRWRTAVAAGRYVSRHAHSLRVVLRVESRRSDWRQLGGSDDSRFVPRAWGSRREHGHDGKGTRVRFRLHVLHGDKRENDLAEVLDAYPGLLGIGIDEGTAIVVTGRRFKVIGASQVVIHDRYWPRPADQKYELLSPGDVFDLCCRRKVAAK
ncbi:MAG: cyanophycinase [Planctomycetota bacterium]|nr:MAG: cyanophycinase [Planctomycetota bacterium]